jgi:hypothetical protein
MSLDHALRRPQNRTYVRVGVRWEPNWEPIKFQQVAARGSTSGSSVAAGWYLSAARSGRRGAQSNPIWAPQSVAEEPVNLNEAPMHGFQCAVVSFCSGWLIHDTAGMPGGAGGSGRTILGRCIGGGEHPSAGGLDLCDPAVVDVGGGVQAQPAVPSDQ